MKEFSILLKRAQEGSPEATEQLLKTYMPMIEKYARLDGKTDEDLRQHLIVCFLLALRKFELND
ncbi:MAG TPA: helix-turn-helix domain-containing protein [Candidatus Pullichristensenella stercorigallinarum]|uniref:Helix-turn-helix domain-containing protein n=1 Tax=Candidatus Pullichristensenella stercorigallinarum TaxID=2840909 RepID=A0A9D0ZNL7_9FIRM|nr:helix-turn-helix domain-containing protein [Candidatus Pullichristensenella stercorigallinarum]